MARKKFTKLESAEHFAKAVNGQVNDCRNIETAKFNYSVTYEITPKTKAYNKEKRNSKFDDWCPEEYRDFGYPNWYWKD